MSITNLPIELIDKICENLDPSDWHSLRMSSKALNKKTLIKFGDYHCKTIRIIVTSDGLRRLEEIAQHEIFRVRARELVILPSLFGNYDNMSYDWFTKSPFGKPSWPRCQWSDSDLDSRFKRYQAAAADHRNALNNLEKTLARCLPRFENLDAFSLQSTSARSLLNPEAFVDCLGLRQFKTQLECQVQRLVQLGNAEVGKVNAFALSALLKAIISANRKTRKLTCAGIHCGVASANMTLVESEYERVLPLLQSLESLHFCPWTTKKNDHAFKNLIDFILACAPNLRLLALSDYSPPGALKIRGVSSLSSQFHFTQLHSLHLHSVMISCESFKNLLSSGSSTLKSLTLESVTINDKIESSSRKLTEVAKSEVRQLWRHIWNFLRDDLTLGYLKMEGLAFRGTDVRLCNLQARLSGKSRSEQIRAAVYDEKRATLSFRDWIDALRAEPSTKPSGLDWDAPWFDSDDLQSTGRRLNPHRRTGRLRGRGEASFSMERQDQVRDSGTTEHAT